MSRTLASEIDDSKKLDASTRERICRELKSLPGIEITVSAASVSEIARLNILHATMLAMRRAVSRLEQSPDAVIVDGNRRPTMDCRTLCIIGGDASSTSIAAASIVAKVVRDRLMARLALRFPGYGWDKNAGYATAAHRDALRRLGPTPHHRAAFGTVRQLAARAQLPIVEMECSS